MMHYTILPKRHWILGRSQSNRTADAKPFIRDILFKILSRYTVAAIGIYVSLGTGDLSGRKICLLWHKAYSFCQADYRGIVTGAWVGCCW